MVEERDTTQISDHTPDILLSRTSAREAQMNGESRAKGRSGVFLPRVSLALASTRLKKVKKRKSLVLQPNFLQPKSVVLQYLWVTWLTSSSIL